MLKSQYGHQMTGKRYPDAELRVRLNMDCAPSGIELLSPSADMRWNQCALEINPPKGRTADFYVVLANARPFDRCLLPRGNSLLIVGEPPEKKLYPGRFYAQFAHVVDTHALSGHPGLRLGAPGLNWHVGLDFRKREYRYGYDYLASLEYPGKENKIAVVCSDAAHTPGQRRRLALLEFLKNRLGNRLVHFGRGFIPIDDKLNAILPYRYHLVLENSQSPNYWTEKIADAYLGWAFPIYLGCPNIFDYFPRDSLISLDGEDFESIGRILLDCLDTPVGTERIAAIGTARDLVLNRYNPFTWSAHWARTLYQENSYETYTVRTHKAFRPFPLGALYRLRKISQPTP